MIDLHNHILPGIDDGSKSIEESISMLKTASEQGITDVVCTVHYQHPKMKDKKINYSIANESMQFLQNKIIDLNIKLHLGSEVFYLPNLLDIKSDKLTVFKHGKYMLIEFYPFHYPPNVEENLYQLKLNGTTPIIAHPERNKILQNNIDIIEKLINSGCLMQLDAGSLLGHFGKICQNVSKLLLKRNMIHIIGSDAHNNKKRNFCLSPAFEKAKTIIGHDVKFLVNDNPKKVILGEEIIPFEIKMNTGLSKFFTKIKKLK